MVGELVESMRPMSHSSLYHISMTIDIEKAKGVDLEAARKALAALQREKQKQRERLLLGIEVKQRID